MRVTQKRFKKWFAWRAFNSKLYWIAGKIFTQVSLATAWGAALFNAPQSSSLMSCKFKKMSKLGKKAEWLEYSVHWNRIVFSIKICWTHIFQIDIPSVSLSPLWFYTTDLLPFWTYEVRKNKADNKLKRLYKILYFLICLLCTAVYIRCIKYQVVFKDRALTSQT